MMQPSKAMRSATDARTRILVAAAAAFAANGFRAASIRNIAIAANVREITVYRYFPRKQDLCWAALDFELRCSDLAVNLSVAIQEATTPEELLRVLSGVACECVRAKPALLRLICFTLLELESESELMYQVHFRSPLSELVDHMRSWSRTGQIRAVHPEAAAVAVIGMLFAASKISNYVASHGGSCESRGDRSADVADICIAGLQSQPQPK